MARDASTQTHWSWLEDARLAAQRPEVDGDSIGQQTQPVLHGGGVAELALPSLHPLRSVAGGEGGAFVKPLEEVQAENEVLRLPEIVDQLQAVDLGSDSSSETDEEGDGKQPPFPDFHASSLPSPAILHYLRESQSLASTFLGLGCDGLDAAAPHGEEGGKRTCDFCGQEAFTPDRDEREVCNETEKALPYLLLSIMPLFTGYIFLLPRLSRVLLAESSLFEAYGGEDQGRQPP